MVLNQDVKLSCTAEDTSVPYILIYKKKPDVIACLPSSLNDNSVNYCPTNITEIHSVTSEMMNRLSLLKELNKQEERIINADERKKKDEQNASKKAKKIQEEDLSNVKSPVNRKQKYNPTSKKRVESFGENLDDAEKVEIRDKDKKKETDCT